MDNPNPKEIAKVVLAHDDVGNLVVPQKNIRMRMIRYVGLCLFIAISLLLTIWLWKDRQFSKHLNLAKAAILDGRNQEALKQLRFCEEVDSDDRRVLLLAADMFRMMQNLTKADELLERYWSLYGDDEQLTFQRLLLKAVREGTDQAAIILQPRLAEGGDKARLIRHALVSGFLREFRHTEAESLLLAWQKELPEDPLAGLLFGKLNEQLFKTTDAIEAYSKIVELRPEHAEAKLKLAMLHMQQRQAENALPYLESLILVLPENTDVAVQRAIALRQVGRTDEGLVALDEALLKFPNSSDALLEKGSVLLNAGEDEKAVDLLTQAIRINPSQVGALSLRAEAYTRLGKIDEAADDTKRIKDLNSDADRLTTLINGPLQSRPNDPNPPFEIAGIALRAGHPAEAIHWYETALKRNPNHAPSHTALAVIYHEMGNPVLATQHRALAARASGK